MDFSIGEDRQMLVDSFSRYLADKAGWEAREAAIDGDAGFDPAMWRGAAELGVLGALFAEEAGGFGGAPFDIAVVFGEIGRALTPGPFLATLMAGTILAEAGDTATLEGVIAGETIVTLAHEPAVDGDGQPLPEMSARSDGGGWTLSGTSGVVDYLGSADRIVVIAQKDGAPAAFLVDAQADGVAVRAYPKVDGGAAGELALDGTAAVLLSEGDDAISAATAAGLLAVAWEAVAVMGVLRDMTLDYMRTRKQFGVQIGKFQALQHRMATVALEIEQAHSAAINAAANFDKGTQLRDRFGSAAKYTIGATGRLVAEEAIQLHGGIGMTWELPLSHYAKRLVMLNHVLGSDDEHLARFIAASRAA